MLILHLSPHGMNILGTCIHAVPNSFCSHDHEAIEVLKFYKIMGDIIYVDAAHEYKSVSNDMERYWEILQDNGYMMGDDYHENWRGVIQAVEEFSTQKNIPKQLDGVVWSFYKGSERS